MSTSSELWTKLKAAEQHEQAATVAHDAAELLGSSPAYTAAFEALADSRAALQLAQDAYKAAVKAEEAADMPKYEIYDQFSHLNDTEVGIEALAVYEQSVDAGKSEVESEVLASNVLQRAGYNVNAKGGVSIRACE